MLTTKQNQLRLWKCSVQSKCCLLSLGPRILLLLPTNGCSCDATLGPHFGMSHKILHAPNRSSIVAPAYS